MNHAQNVTPVLCTAVLTTLSFLCESVAKKSASVDTTLSTLLKKADQMSVETFESTFVARCVFFTFHCRCSELFHITIWHTQNNYSKQEHVSSWENWQRGATHAGLGLKAGRNARFYGNKK